MMTMSPSGENFQTLYKNHEGQMQKYNKVEGNKLIERKEEGTKAAVKKMRDEEVEAEMDKGQENLRCERNMNEAYKEQEI